MGKKVNGMPLDIEAELMKLSRLAASTETGTVDEQSRQFLLDRLTALDDISRTARGQVAEVVRELRELPLDERATWPEIGDALGINPDAALKRFSTRAQPLTTKRGYSLSSGAREVGISRSTAYSRIRANPNAEWYALVPTNNGKLVTETYRILDLDGLRSASANWASSSNSKGGIESE